jgi:hypothetical protein
MSRGCDVGFIISELLVFSDAHPPPPYACLSRVSFGILHDIRFHTVTIAQRSVQLEQAL